MHERIFSFNDFELSNEQKSGVLSTQPVQIGGVDGVLRYSSFSKHDPFTRNDNNPVLKARLALVLPEYKSTLQKFAIDDLYLSLDRGEVACHELMFDDSIGDVVYVTSKTLTRPGYTGNGLSFNLGLMHDQVISDTLERNAERFRDKAVISRMVDVGVTLMWQSGTNGRSIASRLAEALGYERVNNHGNYPCYEKVIV